MMHRLSVELKPSLLNATLISIFLHFSVFNIFTFTFIPKLEEHRPLLLFLGAILQKQDFEEIASTPKTTRLIPQEMVLLPRSANLPIQPPVVSIDKPTVLPQNLHKNQKPFIKTQFEETTKTSPVENKPKANTIIDEDENVAPYIPLRSIFK